MIMTLIAGTAFLLRRRVRRGEQLCGTGAQSEVIASD
jgi:hypothetical protein